MFHNSNYRQKCQKCKAQNMTPSIATSSYALQKLFAHLPFSRGGVV